MAKKKLAVEPTPLSAQPTASAGYTVLARRYRPQTFEELVGQDAVSRVLANAIQGERVAHAYLFCGPRGVGKTSTARILAKALNCAKGPTPQPCGVCAMCESIASGEDVDVLEIDGASNRGIEEIREIRGNVQYRPSRARYKIYIIDEVHMLTTPAFNALLKTLEEPPAHVKFIFATTNAQDVPITILSRCQRFDFAGIPLRQIVDRLRQIVQSEQMQADDEALELIARRAGGSMRDAQSLLDQLLAFGDERLTTAQVHQLLGTASDDRLLALAAAILGRDIKLALELVGQATGSGLLLGELVEQLIGYWRDLMLLHCASDASCELTVTARHRPTLLEQARATPLDTILAGLDILALTRQRLTGSNHARTLVELAVVRLSRLTDLAPLAQLAQLVARSRTEGESGARPAPPRATVTTIAPPEDVKKKPVSPAPADSAEPVLLELNAANLSQIWPSVLASVGGMLAGNLEHAGLPAISGPKTLVLNFPAGYNQAREHCQRPTSIARIEDAICDLVGQRWVIRVNVGVGSEAPPVRSEPEAPVATPSPRRNPRDEAEQVPLVQRALTILNAQIVRADEGFGETTASPETVPDSELLEEPIDEEVAP